MELKPIAELPQDRSIPLHDIAFLSQKFSRYLDTSSSLSDALSVFLLQFLLLESTSPRKTLTNLPKVQVKGNVQLTLCNPAFLSTHSSAYSQVANSLRSDITHSTEELLTRLSSKLNLQITVVNAGTNKFKVIHPKEISTSSFHIYGLLHENCLTLLLSRKQEALLSHIQSFDVDTVIQGLSKTTQEIDAQKSARKQAALEEILAGIQSYLKPMLAFATTIVKTMNEQLTENHFFRLCADSVFAESLKGIFDPLMNLKKSPKLLSDDAQISFLALSRELACNSVPYSFILRCEMCKSGLVSERMPICKHGLCAECTKKLFNRSTCYIDSDGRCLKRVSCPCCQTPQPSDQILMQNSEMYRKERDKVSDKSFCSVCKRLKPKVLFGEKCCSVLTCARCLVETNSCSSCGAAAALAVKKASCQKCRRPDLIEKCFSGPCMHVLCRTCQAGCLSTSRCPFCQPGTELASISGAELASIRLKLTGVCTLCRAEKSRALFYDALKCEHLVCKSCASNSWHSSNFSSDWILRCSMCSAVADKNAIELSNSELLRLRCIYCSQIFEESGPQLAAATLQCGCVLHVNCQKKYIDYCLNSGLLVACQCRVELDHSIILQYEEFEHYFECRYLVFEHHCTCRQRQRVKAAFDVPKSSSCECGKTLCVLCGENWDKAHADYGLCKFADAFKRFKEMMRNSKQVLHQSQVMQCPICLEPAILSSVNLPTTITCAICSTVYCSSCCVPNEEIKQHGATYHREGCSYLPESKYEPYRCGKCKNMQNACPRPMKLVLPRQFAPMEYKAEKQGNR